VKIACFFPSDIGLEKQEDQAFILEGLRSISPPDVQADLKFAAKGKPFVCSLDVDNWDDPAAKTAYQVEQEGYDGILLDVT